MRNLIEFEYSPWLVVLCIIVGLAYAVLQYSKNSPWNKTVNYALAILRAVLVTLIAIALLGPSVRAIRNYYESPIMVFAIDNSASIGMTVEEATQTALVDRLKNVKRDLEENGWSVNVVGLDGSNLLLDSLRFDGTRTDLTKMLRTQFDEYKGANLGGALVVSDGIFNAGFSPDLIASYVPVYSLGLGDTIPQRDLSIIDIEYNKTVYQDNKFPILVKIRNEGIESGMAKMKIFYAGQIAGSTTINFSSSKRIVEHEFILDATEPGKQRISIQLDSIPGESTAANNGVSLYVDVIDGKQKILLAAEAPSPDIKAFRAAIEANNRFEIHQVIGESPAETNYDLIVLFNSPSKKSSLVYNSLSELSTVPRLFFIGASTNLRPYISSGVLSFSSLSNKYDLVRGSINTNQKAFNLINDFDEWLTKVPPITVPFGDIGLTGNTQVILNQRVGSVTTERPIVFINEEGPKTGVILGDGWWTWRLDEYRNFGETSRFDELLVKLTQYLAAKPDNRQFKLYPIKEGFEVGEELTFIAETYNQLFEPVYGEPVSLTVIGENDSWSYSFTPLSGSNKFTIDNIPEGLYSYSGSTTIDGRKQTANGQFTITKPSIEAADLTADHLTLRKLSDESGGEFYNQNELAKLETELASLEANSVIHSQENEILLFNLFWVFILLILLATSEWLTRKMMGSY